MNAKDIEILHHLQRDATLTHQALAEATGMSAATVWRRIQSLEAAGILAGRVALVDPGRAGLKTTALALVNLHDHAPDSRATFERLIATSQEVLECFSVSGTHDYHLLIRVRDIEAYEHFLMERLLACPVVASAQTSFVLRQMKYTTVLPL